MVPKASAKGAAKPTSDAHFWGGLVVSTCAVVLFTLLFRTVSPSIAGGDSGELVAEGCILGTAHPPGYPLYTLLVFGIKSAYAAAVGHFTNTIADKDQLAAALTRLGSVAYEVNVFSAFLTAAAAYCIGRLVLRARPDCRAASAAAAGTESLGGGAVLAMGLFTFSPLIWQYATTSEVFPLNTFFAALLLLLVLAFAQTGSFRLALLGAFVCGLALCNQHTIVLYEAPLILWVAFLLRRRVYQRPIATCLQLGACLLLGLAPYAYLPISAMVDPQHGSWGHVSTLEGFLHHFLRRDYGTFRLFSGAQGQDTEGLWVRNAAYAHDAMFVQGLYVCPTLAVVAILCWRRVSEPAPVSAPTPTTASASASAEVEATGGASAAAETKPGHDTAMQAAPAAVDAKKAPEEAMGGKKDKKRTPGKTTAHAVPTAAAAAPLLGDCSVSPSEANYTPLLFLLTQLFYFGIFHTLANLPLGNKLLYGIHQRFWMQPNVLMFAWAGIGYDLVFRGAIYMLHLVSRPEVPSAAVGAGMPGPTAEPAAAHGPTLTLTEPAAATGPVHTTPSGADKHSVRELDKGNKKKKAEQGQGAKRAAAPAARPRPPLPAFLTLLVQLASLGGAILLVHLQHSKWLFVSDQSAALYWRNYASAILDGLPDKAVLLINYDMQWTSVRYLQKCEGFRADVIAINLSMMTYTWFHNKRQLYPTLTFPGTYLAPPNVAAHQRNKAFTLKAFLDANSPTHPIYLGGKVNYPDPELDSRYSFIPAGLVSKIVPNAASPNGTVYNRWNQVNWVHVIRHLEMLPDMRKYPEETWEWTINRDFRDRVMGECRYLLLLACTLFTVFWPH